MINFKVLYKDIIKDKFPEFEFDNTIISKIDDLDNSAMKIFYLNNFIFYNTENSLDNIDSRLKSYTENEILDILRYQNAFNLSNTEIVKEFRMSRTTLILWKRRFKKLFI